MKVSFLKHIHSVMQHFVSITRHLVSALQCTRYVYVIEAQFDVFHSFILSLILQRSSTFLSNKHCVGISPLNVECNVRNYRATMQHFPR